MERDIVRLSNVIEADATAQAPCACYAASGKTPGGGVLIPAAVDVHTGTTGRKENR